MPTFCQVPNCGADMFVCQSCGHVMCSHGHDGNWEAINTPVAHGNYCTRCLGGMTEIHQRLRDFSQFMGNTHAMILQTSEAENTLYYRKLEAIARKNGCNVVLANINLNKTL